MLHANFMALCFTEPELLRIEVLHCGNRSLDLFASYLDLDSMTFTYELDPDSLRYTEYANELAGNEPVA